jgi:hypothetical protein
MPENPYQPPKEANEDIDLVLPSYNNADSLNLPEGFKEQLGHSFGDLELDEFLKELRDARPRP